MAGRLECFGGGIAGLLTLLGDEKQREALEFDLIALGKNIDDLGTRALSWRDLLVIVRQAPRGSALHAAQSGESATWGVSEQLLAAVFDRLGVLIWQQTEDGQKNRNPPSPLPRPGMEPERLGSDSRPIEEVQAWLAARNPNQHQPA